MPPCPVSPRYPDKLLGKNSEKALYSLFKTNKRRCQHIGGTRILGHYPKL